MSRGKGELGEGLVGARGQAWQRGTGDLRSFGDKQEPLSFKAPLEITMPPHPTVIQVRVSLGVADCLSSTAYGPLRQKARCCPLVALIALPV